MNTPLINDAEIDEVQQESPVFYLKKVFWAVLILFLGAFMLRLLLTNVIHGHPTDIMNFKLWSKHAAQHPLRHFYQSVSTSGIWADYPPLYILVLWGIGKFYMLFDPSISELYSGLFTALIKLPAILADLGCMALLLLILKRYIPFRLAYLAAFIFAIHPAVIYESAMWGQIDSITLFLQMLALWLLIEKDYAAAILVTTLNILVKPQGLILMPLILVLTLYRKQFVHLVVGLFSSALVGFVLSVLFVPIQQVIPWLWDQYVSQANLYGYSSIQAFNLWSLSGFWQSDISRGIFGVGGGAPAFIWQHKTWGLILFSVCYALALGIMLFHLQKDKSENDSENGVLIWHISALIMIAFFLFPTRMHERYLYSGLFFLLGSAFLQKKLLWPFGIYSLTFLLNLFYELPGDKLKLKFPGLFYKWNHLLIGQPDASGHLQTFQWYKLIVIVNLLLFAWCLFVLLTSPILEYSKRIQNFMSQIISRLKQEAKPLSGHSIQDWIPSPKGLDRLDVRWLGGILFFSAILKLWRIGFPPEMVFDEVYHARAAGEYLLAIKPLEWVHPPLAKLLIAVGVSFYDLTGVGWRVMPIIAGTLLLVSMYSLARFILPYRWQAVVATIMLACDGVYFVQSRMAMTNIFATFFQVSALTFAWRFVQYFWHRPQDKRNYIYFVISILFIALALSTRWTSLWSYGFIICVFGFLVLVPSTLNFGDLLSGKIKWTMSRRVAWMWLLIPSLTVLIPFVVYLIAYTPYYVNYGYDIAKVLKEQVGIWNYHSNLNSPHPYYSAWYTWPWLVRPTWYYFENYGNGTIGGILAVGNPAIWWFSMPAVAVTLGLAWLQKRMSLFYIGLACLFMYLPWGMSPRTLNYAHYFFEAVPYACLSATAVMAFLIQSFRKTGFIIASVYFGLVCGLFAMFYPIYSALPIPWAYYNILRWFPSWV